MASPHVRVGIPPGAALTPLEELVRAGRGGRGGAEAMADAAPAEHLDCLLCAPTSVGGYPEPRRPGEG